MSKLFVHEKRGGMNLPGTGEVSHTRHIESPMAVLLVFVVLLTGCLFPTGENEAAWDQLGLAGMQVTALAETPLGLFAGTDANGVFRYDPGDSSWVSVGLRHATISALLYRPGNPSAVLASVTPRALGDTTAAAVFRTEDEGATWRESDGGLARAFGGWKWAWELGAHSSDRDIVFMGLSFSILRSVDGGFTWTFVFGDSTSGAQGVTSIVPDPNEPARMWATYISAFGTSAVVSSADTGRTWTVHFPFPTIEIPFSDLHVDPSSSDRLRLALPGGVLRSDDGGTTWNPELEGIHFITQLVTFPGGIIAVGSQLRSGEPRLSVFRIDSAEQGWKPMSTVDVAFGFAAIVTAAGDLVVGTAGDGVWRLSGVR